MNNKQVPPSVAQFAVSERAELLARIAAQAREIERLRLNIAEYNEHERYYQSELAALKAQPSGVVPPTKAQGVVMPDGWIPLTIEHEPGYPEDVAFGPK